jgi:hypothetical protein
MGIVTNGFWVLAAVALCVRSDWGQGLPKGTIEGDVVDTSTGQGISGARVRLQCGQDDPAFTTADAQGHFQLTGMEFQSYQVTARYPGFISAREADATSGPQIVRLMRTVPNGQVRLEMRRYGVIEGKVTDALGVPVAGVAVEALQRHPAGRTKYGYIYNDGSYQYVGHQQAVTNDLGEYRIAPVPPGSYYVFVPMPGPVSSYYARQPEVRPRTDVRERSTFYPHAQKPSETKPVELAEGKELRADVQLIRQEGVKVSGRIFGLSSTPTDSVTVVVQSLPFAPLLVPVTVTGDRFTAADLLPGKYIVGAGQYAAPVTVSGNLLAAARRTIDVGKDDIDGVDLTLAPAPNVEGRLVFESGCATTPVWIQLMSDLNSSPPRNLPVDAEGRFVLQHLFPGKYKALVGIEGTPNGSARSIKLGDAEVLTDGFEVTAETKVPLHITMGCTGR